MYTKIAHRTTFEGAPRIQSPGVHGASPGKPILYRVPVLGERPMTFSVTGLPEGLTMNEKGIFSGAIAAEGNYTVTFRAENARGVDEKEITFEIAPDHVMITPMMGYTTWTAYVLEASDACIRETAQVLEDSGMAEYGYNYVNIDSSWQDDFDEDKGYVTPNEKFPDMKKLCEDLHALGFKVGIYSTPLYTAFGSVDESKNTGVTRGAVDPRFPIPKEVERYIGICMEHHEKEHAAYWADCGFDYLKYDWVPCDTYNAHLMKEALLTSPRDFAYCVTTAALFEYVEYWSKHCCLYRNGPDAWGNWDNFLSVINDKDRYLPYVNPCHYYDMDMMSVGEAQPCFSSIPSHDEMLSMYSMHVIFPSSIQITCRMKDLTDWDLDMLCNEEIIAVNQDPACLPSQPFFEEKSDKGRIKVYKRPLHDGSYALGIFNLGETDMTYTLPDDMPSAATVRDLWAKEDISHRHFDLKPHCCRMIKVTE